LLQLKQYPLFALFFQQSTLTIPFSLSSLFIIDIFYPLGADPTYPLILLQSLRCNPLVVVHYSFVGHCLDFAATSTRE